MKRKDRLPMIVSRIVLAFLLVGGLYLNSYGGTYKYPFREYFDGSTADSVSWTLWMGADSISTYDTTSAASVLDSILVHDSLSYVLRFRAFFFGLTDPNVGSWEHPIIPLYPVISGGGGGSGSFDPDNDSVWVKGGSVDSNRTEQGGAGSGTYTVTLKFLDTSTAPDAFIPKVSVDLRGWNTSTLQGTATTNESGVALFGTDADSVAFKGVGPSAQYVWPINWEDSVANSGNLTDTVKGYFIDVPVASGSQVCAVTVIVLDNGGRPARNIPVSTYLTRSNLRDSAGYAVANYTQTQKTDSLGRATFECRWSSYLIPATKWRFSVGSPSNSRKDVTVPRQTSYTLQF